ncbi:MAG: choice-of-anchor B family protein [Saprospiraceae bacterium]|nr:choice-of-anchor B family protein [Saprospiraceae bacterium]
MKRLAFAVLTAMLCWSGVNAQLNASLESSTSYGVHISDVWGYASGANEYALVGLWNGVNILDVTDPANPVDKGTATGPNSTWRDIKTFGDYAYCTNESNDGLLIIDLSGLPNSITASDWSYWEPNIPGVGVVNDCHNIFIDDNGYGYLAGCSGNNSGGILYIDLFTTPGTPTYVDKGPAVYAHDVFVQNNIMFTSEIYAGKMSLYNVADKTNTIFLGDASTPSDFTHNVWVNAAGTMAFATDEVANAPISAWDVSDPGNIVAKDQFKPLATIGTGVIPHNVHVADDYLIISHYSDGVVVVDASAPDNMIEVANYDTYTGAGQGYNGNWGAFPFLPSGNILVSDQDNGLFVVNPTYMRAARLEGKITDATSGAAILNATVVIDDPQANEGKTDFNGDYKTGIATAGTFNVTITAPNYDAKIVSATISNGSATILDETLSATSLPLELLAFDAKLGLQNEVELSWDAAQSDGIFEFELQRSEDGMIFRTMETVFKESMPGITNSFSTTDNLPSSGTYYYRLKMVEPDRSFDYGPIRDVTLNFGGLVELFPNPLKKGDLLTITGDFVRNREYVVRASSILGQAMQYVVPANDLFSVNSQRLFSGMNYVEILENGNLIYSGKVLVRD